MTLPTLLSAGPHLDELEGYNWQPKPDLARKLSASATHKDCYPFAENPCKFCISCRFHAVIAGADPSKPLMLMLHGFPEMWYSWRHQLEHFQDDFECVAVDLRGYGETDKPKVQCCMLCCMLLFSVDPHPDTAMMQFWLRNTQRLPRVAKYLQICF